MSWDIDEDLQELDRQIQHMHNPWGEDMDDVLALLEKDYTKPQAERPFPAAPAAQPGRTPAPEPWDAWLDDPGEGWTQEQLQPRLAPQPKAPPKPRGDKLVGTLIAVAAVQCVAIAALLAIWLL